MRVFAGPNGSGKSTIIQAVREYKVKSIPLDFGIYINADEIAGLLRKKKFDFKSYKVVVTNREFRKIVLSSGLIGAAFSEEDFSAAYRIRNNKFVLLDESADERMAQIIADFLRNKLLKEKKKFSFETVFSHPSKLAIMREALPKQVIKFTSTSLQPKALK